MRASGCEEDCRTKPTGVSHFVNIRVLPGEDAGVRRRRQRRLRDRVLKQDAALRQPVQRRRFDVRISVAVQMIGTKRVHGDHHDVERTQPGNFAGATRERPFGSGMAAGQSKQDNEDTAAGAGREHRRRTIWFSI